MCRNVIVLCDGTANEFGKSETNVVRTLRVIEGTTADQLVYYDPGVGTLPDPTWHSRLVRQLSIIPQLAIGTGLMTKVLSAYTYLMNYVEPDDRVFLFGFSRGAYTVRVLAGLLHMLGLVPRGNEHLLPYLSRYYNSIRSSTPEDAHEQWQMCDDFRRTFARPAGDDRHFGIEFLGVWDTVSSIGWFWEPRHFPYSAHNPSIKNIWHAVSIDEHRAFYRSNLFQIDKNNPQQVFKQCWFPGDHCDVGGGHSDGALWRRPFEWMVAGAHAAGLDVNQSLVDQIAAAAKPRVPWDMPHDMLHGPWKLLEYIPKKTWDATNGTSIYRANHFRRRTIPMGATIDDSARQMMRDTKYHPSNVEP